MSEKCDAQTETKVTDRYGNALPPEVEPCKRDAKWIVKRRFTGVEQQLCASHSTRFRKDMTGAFECREVSGSAA